MVLVPGPLGGTSWRKQTAALMVDGYASSRTTARLRAIQQVMTGYDYDTLADDLHKVLTHLTRDTALVGFRWAPARSSAISTPTARDACRAPS